MPAGGRGLEPDRGNSTWVERDRLLATTDAGTGDCSRYSVSWGKVTTRPWVGMSMTLASSLSATTQDGSVAFRYEVRNEGSETVDLQFTSGQTHDVIVRRDGDDVWRFAAGRMFAQMLQSESIPSGENLTYECSWDDPEPGEYEARAHLAANDEECEASTTFTV